MAAPRLKPRSDIGAHHLGQAFKEGQDKPYKADASPFDQPKMDAPKPMTNGKSTIGKPAKGLY